MKARHRSPRAGIKSAMGRAMIARLVLLLVLAFSMALPGAIAAGPGVGAERSPAKLSPSPSPAAAKPSLRGSRWSAPDVVTKPLPGLDSSLSALAETYSLQTDVNSLASQLGVRTDGERVQVQISVIEGAEAKVTQAVVDAGGAVTSQIVGRLQAWVPASELASLAAGQAVLRVARPVPVTLLEAQVISEGVAPSNATIWHDLGYNGAGVHIGIIDGGFAGYHELVSRGELPALVPGVNARNFVDGESDAHLASTTDHGAACAEVAHDMAPKAQFSFAKIGTDMDLAQAVAWLIETRQVDIISTSLAWYNVTPGDGTGFFADLAADAAAAGVTWVSAAGNEAKLHWGGTFASIAGEANVHTFYGADQRINWFGPGDHSNGYLVPAGAQVCIYLRWDDWARADQDFDLYLTRWHGASETFQTVARSIDVQAGRAHDRPTETIIYRTTTEGLYGVAIQRFDATRDVHFELFAPDQTSFDVSEAARSIGNLADVPDVIAVGAVPATSPYDLASYSSWGPSNGPGGTPDGGQPKPDICAYTNVSCATVDTLTGTSAATPHVAGAAALVKQCYPAYTPAELRAHLQTNALDLGAVGHDMGYGSGRLHLPAPLAASFGFDAPEAWVADYTPQRGNWLSQDLYPRMSGDVNGDQRADVVGFGNKAVYVSLSSGHGLTAPQPWISAFGPATGGWASQDRYPRAMGDLNGDGRDDIVGFGERAVYVSLSDGARFGPLEPWLAGYVPAAGGWTSYDRYPRCVADVNGDGRDDVIGFGERGVFVSLSDGSSLGVPQFWIKAYGPASGGWASQNIYPRSVADMNGDGLADVIGFGHRATYVSLSTGSSFGAPQVWLAGYGPAAGGWIDFDTYPRVLADVNDDARADVIGFGARGTYVSLSNGGALGTEQLSIGAYGPLAGGWTSYNLVPRTAGDIDADGRADLIGFGYRATYVSLDAE